MKAHFYVQIFVSGGRQLCSLLYPVRQLHHVCRVDAEESVQDFRQLRPGLDPPQVALLFLCAERALHRCRPHPGKFLSDKVFSLLIIAERPSSLHERCLYPILLAPHYRSYERLDSQVRSHTLSRKSEALCHRIERKQLLHPAHLTLLKRDL